MNKAWAKENAAGNYVPYTEQITPTIVKTESGDYVSVLRITGIAHESADDEDIVSWKEQLNSLWKNLAAPDLCFYTHTVRRVESSYPGGDFNNDFCIRLNDKYKSHMRKTKMRVNELYVTIVYRPNHSAVNAATSGFFEKIWKGITKFLGIFGVNFESDEKALRQFHIEQQLEAIEKLNDHINVVKSAMKRYGPFVLSTYEENNAIYSEVLEFFGYLINGEWQKFPLPKGKASYFLPTTRLFFGTETIEMRFPDKNSRYGACISFKEYPAVTAPGFLNALLSVPFDFVLTESFVPKSKAFALNEMQRTQRKMVNAGEVAQSLIDELDDALDDVSAGRIIMGEHHLSMMVFADSRKELKNNLAIARGDLIDLSIVIAREDVALEAAYWAQLPGNFKYRPRPSLINSRNFSGLASFHNFPSGRLKYNQWGDAVTMFRTTSGTPFFFNHHEALDKKPKKDEEEKNQQKALANTLIIGPSGSGKTVVQSFLMAQLEKFNPTMFIFDKDLGLEIFVRRMRGFYSAIRKGEPTGFNPFYLEPTEENIIFLEKFVKKLATTDKYSPSIVEERKISDAIRDILKLPLQFRSLSALLSYLDSTKLDGAHAHLKKWCSQTGDGKKGSNAWLFDSGPDMLDFSNNRIFGFDVTQFLDDDELRTPVVMYLFHRMEQLIDGRRFVCFLDEFWKMLLDKHFEDFAQNKLKTIRKQNGFLVFGTQSPKDVIKSPIAHSIIEQCPTQLYMPNDKASEEDYINGFKLTRREYEIIKEEMTGRKFLIKQSGNSIVAELNLQGFDNELAIMSGTTDNVVLLEHIIAEVGEDPDIWEPIFHERRSA